MIKLFSLFSGLGAFEKVNKAKISDTQLYKICGNSIVVPVLEAIFRQIYLTEKK